MQSYDKDKPYKYTIYKDGRWAVTRYKLEIKLMDGFDVNVVR